MKKEIIQLQQVSKEDWLEFLNSLTTERETWSLDYNVINSVTNTQPKTPEEFYHVYKDGNKIGAWVTKLNGKISGYISCNPWHPTDADTFKHVFSIGGEKAWQLSIVVHRDYQGQNIGTDMIKYVKDFYTKHNIPADMYGAVISIKNPGSVRAFEKAGLSIVSNWPPSPPGDQFLLLDRITKTPQAQDLLVQDATIIDGHCYRSPISNCLSVYNNIDYMKICIESVRRNSYYHDSPFIVYAENCTDGTNEWLDENKDKYNLDVYIETENVVRRGIGGGMNFCADKVKTPMLNFLQADLYACKHWDLHLLRYMHHHQSKFPDIKWGVFSHRIQPDIFNEIETERAGTTFVPEEAFGAYHDDFNHEKLDRWVEEFSKLNKDVLVRKAEGVSGLFYKKDWDYIGGNDDRFAPAYWEDADLFIRMMNKGFDFVLTAESVLYHFASRSSRFPDDNLKERPKHLADVEQNSLNEFVKKYGRLPHRDENDMVIPLPIIDGSPNCIQQESK